MVEYRDKLENLFNNIINGAVSGAVTSLLPIIVAVVASVYNEKQIAIYITIAVCAIYLLLLFVLGHRHKIKRISSGREDLMYKNTQLIQKNNIEKIYSTRVTYWTLDESSSNRVNFRNALTEKINAGIEIRRLWHIRCKEDIQRLEYYLEKYKGCDNLAVRCFYGDGFILPELLISYPYAASVSLPQQNSPKRICVAYHFQDKKGIGYWMNYFNVLWEVAMPILYSGNVQTENLNKIKDMYWGNADK